MNNLKPMLNLIFRNNARLKMAKLFFVELDEMRDKRIASIAIDKKLNIKPSLRSQIIKSFKDIGIVEETPLVENEPIGKTQVRYYRLRESKINEQIKKFIGDLLKTLG